MTYHFRNLIFEGGGVKGIAYAGALQELERKDILPHIERIGGASAGAINAVLLALDYTYQEQYDILKEIDFKLFMDDSWGVIRDVRRLVREYGWYKGDFFRSWIGKLIKDKSGNENTTFYELRLSRKKDLYLIGTNLSTGFSEVFSAEHTPRMRIIDAVRISMSIPLFFAAVRYMNQDIYVDGGVLDNFPIKLFDREKYIDRSRRAISARKTGYYNGFNKNMTKNRSKYVYNKETLGFRLDCGREIAMFRDGAEPIKQHINDFFDYAWALINTMMNAQVNRHLHNDDWHRTIYINTINVKTTDFSLNEDTKNQLIKEGEKGVQQYFAWYDRADKHNMPINHPDCHD